MTAKQITFKVFRFKEGDKAPHYEKFSVLCDENTTVLTALQDIRRDKDPSLMLRHSCHHASCGTCGMIINGREELACVVKVLDLKSDTVVVKPLNNIPIISDLVVDMNDFFAKYNIPKMSYIRESEFLSEAEPPNGIKKYTRHENCIECGLCVSGCPIAGTDSSYLGPAAMAAAWRVIEKSQDDDSTETVLDWIDSENGCWRCHIAYECSGVCPSNVNPADSIMSLRNKIIKRKIRRLFTRDFLKSKFHWIPGINK